MVFLKRYFNILLLFLVKIFASYRLQLVELLCRINCCSIHAKKPRTVEWNGKSRTSVIKRPPAIQASWHYFSLIQVQVLRTLLTCFQFELLDVVSLLAAQKEITLHFNFLSNLTEAAFLYASSSQFENEKRSPSDIL